MLWLSVCFGVFAAIGGYWLAHWLDANIAWSITTILAVVFLLVYFFAPKKWMLSVMYRQKQQRTEVSLLTFLLHLNNHKEAKERHINHLREHINWQQVKANTVVKLALDNNMITITDNVITLTQKGLSFTKTALEYIITNKDEKIEHLKDDFFLFRG